MLRHALLLVCLLTALVPVNGADQPVDLGLQELHGTFAGQPFWARLQAPDKQFGGNHVLELVYTPPTESDLGGTHLSDCPFVLLDGRLRVVAWNGRDTGSKAVPSVPDGYAVTREISILENGDTRIDLDQRKVAGERGWDLRIAPILLALKWRSGSSDSVRAIDLFGPRHAEAMTITWTDTAITIAGTNYTIVPDTNGRLATLTAADSATINATSLLSVTSRK
jgi:hypothetical protein